MIKAHELRIGNLFNDSDNNACYFAGSWERQDGWILRDSGNNTYKESEVFPIPLTPELLESCGFEIDENSGFSSDGSRRRVWTNRIRVAEYNNSFWLWIHIEEDEWYSFAWTEIKSIHHLQNLYYSICGEELNINSW